MARRTGFVQFLKDFGLTVEAVPGWETRGSESFNPGGVVDHWTAGPRGTTGRPSLSVVTHGRPGLPGPLCNVYLDRRGVVVLVAAGRANHAGLGGYRGLSGNSSVFGIEAESAGNDDWTPEQKWAYPRLNAALLRYLQRDASWVFGHNEWAPTRKIDIRDWDMNAMRKQVADVLWAYDNPKAPEPGKTEPIKKEEDPDMGICFRRRSTGEVIYVNGGIGVAVKGSDYDDYLGAGVKTVNLDDPGFELNRKRFLERK